MLVTGPPKLQTANSGHLQSKGRLVIQLTRLNGERFALNTDLIERIEETPDTILALIDGTRYVVKEPVDDVIDRVIAFRARVVSTATSDDAAATLHLISDQADDGEGS